MNILDPRKKQQSLVSLTEKSIAI